ncbi:MAG: threonylcarbamoyl-AMP synthase, partial [Candidatus Hydrogenedentes bacterium]|nr:threonylcarbamoyl-AMP synthase [Candidatus Hydrogenedentota bacterium]
YPTETVYGLGVNPFSAAAVARLFALKGREAAKPVLLVVADEGQLLEVVEEISDGARLYIQRFWPGPLSLLFRKSRVLPQSLTAGQEKVAVRCPNSMLARELCRVVGHAITSSSANRSGDAPARSLREITLEHIDIGIDGGDLPLRLPSTVFDPDEGTVLREGAISGDELRGFQSR